MAADRQLSRNFWLHEFPGWERATDSDVSMIAETVVRVLQPIRSELGSAVRPTSWLWWSDGTPRTGAHSHAGTIDFVVDGGRTFDAFDWANTALVPAGYIGRLIYEPERTGAPNPQGEHIHMAPRAAMISVYGDPDIQVLRETSEGSYSLYRVAVAWSATALALGGALLFFLARRRGALVL